MTPKGATALSTNSLSVPTNAGKDDEGLPPPFCLSATLLLSPPSPSSKKVFVGDHRFPLELLAGELWR